jgi:hypothetical protein
LLPLYTSIVLKQDTRKEAGTSTTKLNLQPRGSFKETVPNHNATTQAIASKQASATVLKHLNLCLSEIIAKEDTKFRDKYSERISQLFLAHLKTVKKNMGDEFDEKLEELAASTESDILLLEEKYDEKVAEFEEASKRFKDWVNSPILAS